MSFTPPSIDADVATLDVERFYPNVGDRIPFVEDIRDTYLAITSASASISAFAQRLDAIAAVGAAVLAGEHKPVAVDAQGAARGGDRYLELLAETPVSVIDALLPRRLIIYNLAPHDDRALCDQFVAETRDGVVRWAGPVLSSIAARATIET